MGEQADEDCGAGDAHCCLNEISGDAGKGACGGVEDTFKGKVSADHNSFCNNGSNKCHGDGRLCLCKTAENKNINERHGTLYDKGNRCVDTVAEKKVGKGRAESCSKKAPKRANKEGAYGDKCITQICVAAVAEGNGERRRGSADKGAKQSSDHKPLDILLFQGYRLIS